MSTSSIPRTREKLDFEEIIERLSSLSRRLNEEMQSVGGASDQDQLKRSCDRIEGIKKIAAMMFQYFQKFEGDLQNSLSFLESDAEEIINHLPRHQKRNPDLSHYVYHHVNENLMKAESSMRLLHQEFSKRKSRTVCARCEEEDTHCQLEVSSANSKQSQLSEEILIKFMNFISSTEIVLHETIFDLLLPFKVLPANAEVKRRLLENFWIGQELVQGDADCKPLFEAFIRTGIIDPINKKGMEDPKDAKSFKMQPPVHDVVISLAKEATIFFPNESPLPERHACLVQGKKLSYKNFDLIKTLLNVNEQFPDLAVTSKQLSQMRNLCILYLGSWERSTVTAEHDYIRHHIELEDAHFLKAIENMKSLRFLSLQGVSLISKLDVRKLTNLTSLDLKACWNLSELPDEFESLKNLTHLDISGCYFLQRMPPSLATLSKLKVLKGFVINNQHNSCVLNQLPKGLNKLSIKIVSLGFDIEGLSFELLRFIWLWNLKIEWGSGAEVEHKRREWSLRSYALVPIEKLVFHGYPFKILPGWIVPECLRRLKRLYIRGGNLTKLGEAEIIRSPESKFLGKKKLSRKDSTDHREVGETGQKWEHLEILRLKYQGDLEMDWEEVDRLFPKLNYLERVECPRLTSWPCDRNGEWNSAEKQVVETKQVYEIV